MAARETGNNRPGGSDPSSDQRALASQSSRRGRREEVRVENFIRSPKQALFSVAPLISKSPREIVRSHRHTGVTPPDDATHRSIDPAHKKSTCCCCCCTGNNPQWSLAVSLLACNFYTTRKTNNTIITPNARMTNPTPTAMASSNTHTKQPNKKKNTHTAGDRAANVNLHVRSASESTRFSLMEQVFSTSSTMAAVGAATWCRRLTTATTREA